MTCNEGPRQTLHKGAAKRLSVSVIGPKALRICYPAARDRPRCEIENDAGSTDANPIAMPMILLSSFRGRGFELTKRADVLQLYFGFGAPSQGWIGSRREGQHLSQLV